MSKLKALTCVITSVAINTPVAFNKTPHLGSGNRSYLMTVDVLPITSTLLIQTAPRVDSATGAQPASGSSLWTTLATLTSASLQTQEVTPDYWVRGKCTVLDADGPDIVVNFAANNVA